MNDPYEPGGRSAGRTDMGIISWIVVGAIAGVLANIIYPEPSQGGIVAAILLGIVGAVVGGYLAGLVTKRDMTTGINITTIVVAALGALVALVLWNAIF
jgi:uncharacterized membrane protein YeaQ/YmgE (transglycosylase-associated protein family)